MTESNLPTTSCAEADAGSECVRHDIAIVGGGTAGITVAARLTKGWFNNTDVVVIDPSDSHYYQPAWTLVGGGAFRKAATRRETASVVPRKVKWIRDSVTELDPERNRIRTRDGKTIQYNWLIVGAGIKLKWDGIAGLKQTIGKNGVCSNYSYETVDSTWENVSQFEGGTAIFTQPAGAIKCGGAPQKICYLAEDYFRRNGVRDKTRVIFATPGRAIFAVAGYREVLEQVVQRKGIETMFGQDLVAVDPDKRQAIFRDVESGKETALGYDMIHVTPPMSAPDFIARSPLADSAGWVDVDKYTLQHVKFPNVFALGDCSNLPTSKTGAAIRKQAPVLVQNLRSAMAGRSLSARYNGYTSCPVVTGYGRVVLAEFDYDGNRDESFPFDQAKERWSMWLLKKYVLPLLYWKGMLRGRA